MRLSKDPEARQRQILGAEEAANPTPEQIAEGERLAKEGWVQLSRKYRHVARVPPGYTAMEALQEIAPEEAAKILEDAKEFVRNRARMAILHHNSKHPLIQDNRLDLDIGTFAAFRKAGGQPW